MIGLVVVTHGRLAVELIAALEHVVGPQSAVRTICIGPDDDMEKRRKEILSSVEEVDSGKGVILLTDMFGGTPSNLAISIMEQTNVGIIAGVNMPMLIKLASNRKDGSLKKVALEAQNAGRKYINIASGLLDGKKEK